VLEQNKKLNGNYLFHFESNHTDHMVDNNVDIVYVHIIYNVDGHRKIFDKVWSKNEDGTVNDSRRVLPHKDCIILDIMSTTCTDTILPI
jgi:hypothetical protein